MGFFNWLSNKVLIRDDDPRYSGYSSEAERDFFVNNGFAGTTSILDTGDGYYGSQDVTIIENGLGQRSYFLNGVSITKDEALELKAETTAREMEINLAKLHGIDVEAERSAPRECKGCGAVDQRIKCKYCGRETN